MLASETNPPASPLLLSDHLLTLAEEAARAGLNRPAGTLLRLALSVLEDAPGCMADAACAPRAKRLGHGSRQRKA